MKILIIGEQENFEEVKLKFGSDHDYAFHEEPIVTGNMLEHQDIIFDFSIEDHTEDFGLLVELEQPIIFLNTVKVTLAELIYYSAQPSDKIFGFNGLKTFVNRPVLEVSSLDGKDNDTLKNIFLQLQSDYKVVKDRVGMVTPRIIFMIINEAYYTVQEGTANREDIDLGMKLGTNYPYGPFEWIKRIGIADVYETLESIYEDTKDERYKICPLLKKEYLLN